MNSFKIFYIYIKPIQGIRKKLTLFLKVFLQNFQREIFSLRIQIWRKKNYLEIRSLDACEWDCDCAGPAFFTGLVYGKLDEALDVIKNWKIDEQEEKNAYFLLSLLNLFMVWRIAKNLYLGFDPAPNEGTAKEQIRRGFRHRLIIPVT